MAALLEAENPAPQAAQVLSDAASEAGSYSSTGEMIKGRMPELVKGAGFAPRGGNMPLSDQTDILRRASQASLDLRMETRRGYANRSSVVKSMNSGFLNNFGVLRTALETPSIGEQIGSFFGQVASPDLVRSFTAGNLGIGSHLRLDALQPACPEQAHLSGLYRRLGGPAG